MTREPRRLSSSRGGRDDSYHEIFDKFGVGELNFTPGNGYSTEEKKSGISTFSRPTHCTSAEVASLPPIPVHHMSYGIQGSRGGAKETTGHIIEPVDVDVEIERI